VLHRRDHRDRLYLGEFPHADLMMGVLRDHLVGY
jgi:hypothetical protein